MLRTTASRAQRERENNATYLVVCDCFTIDRSRLLGPRLDSARRRHLGLDREVPGRASPAPGRSPMSEPRPATAGPEQPEAREVRRRALLEKAVKGGAFAAP